MYLTGKIKKGSRGQQRKKYMDRIMEVMEERWTETSLLRKMDNRKN